MKNKRLAIKAIQKDCKLQSEYYSHGKTCAIGCLALLSGVPKSDLIKADGKRINCKHYWDSDPVVDTVKSIAARITKRFGLSLVRQAKIQSLNDRYELDVEQRRAAIVEYLKTI